MSAKHPAGTNSPLRRPMYHVHKLQHTVLIIHTQHSSASFPQHIASAHQQPDLCSQCWWFCLLLLHAAHSQAGLGNVTRHAIAGINSYTVILSFCACLVFCRQRWPCVLDRLPPSSSAYDMAVSIHRPHVPFALSSSAAESLQMVTASANKL